MPDRRKDEPGKIDYGRYGYSVPELLKYGAAGFGTGILVCWLCYHSFYAAPLAVLIGALYLIRKKKELLEKRKKQLLYHFRDFLSALHTSLSAGYSLENGIRSVLGDMEQLHGKKDVMVRELRLMAAGMKLRQTPEELFADLGERSGLEDIRLFAELAAVAKRQGGSMGKVLSDTRRIICERIDTQQEIDQLLASKKYEQTIMSIMPAAVIVYLRLTFDGFIEQLYGNITGAVIMTACLAVYAAAYRLGKRIVQIEV